MQSINSFINLLGKNYYSDFLINVNSETIEFDSYGILVKYNSSYYFELNHSEILLKRKEIISSIKEVYHQALSEVYSLMLSQEQLKLNSYLNQSIRTLKSHLNTLRKDFYTDSDESRYYSILEDNPIILDLEIVYQENLRNEGFDIDNKVFDIINNANFKKVESLYFLGFLYQRYKALSFIPFSLFQIGHQFLVELNKIKLLNESKSEKDTVDLKNQSNMKDTYFEKFCEIIDDINILEKSTPIGVLIDLNLCIKEIKSETLKELQSHTTNRNDFLDLKINEVEKCNYDKKAETWYIQKWLDKYNITIEEILNNSWRNNPIAKVIDQHYKDLEKFSKEQDDTYYLQLDFYYYFCKLCADELIGFFESKKTKILETVSIAKQEEPMNKFKTEYLEAFIIEISNLNDIYDSTFIQCYDFGIKRFTDNLISEIKENILIIPSDKLNPYFEYVEDKISSSPYYKTKPSILDKWIKKYEVKNLEFPFLENESVNHLITKSINYHLWDDADRFLMEEIQLDFFYYASMIEAKRITDFIETKRNNSISKTMNSENNEKDSNTKQLTVNQAVILLDKLGMFNSNYFSRLPNTKKAKIISQLLGKNWKNIKTSIESLEKRPSELGTGYQNDLDKIQDILDNLE